MVRVKRIENDNHPWIVFKHGHTDDPMVHVINRFYCMLFFLLVAVTISAKRLVSSPIQCWCPPSIHDRQVPYVDNYCWIRNTYVVDFNTSLSVQAAERREIEIQYYQWTPLFFAFQALLFFFPRFVWKIYTGHSSLNIKKVLKMANEAYFEKGDERDDKIEAEVKYFRKYLKIRNHVTTRHRSTERIKYILVSMGFHKGNYLVFIFLLVSLLYAVSTVLQFWLIDVLLGNDFTTLGRDFISRAVKGDSLFDQRRFPIVTLCDFELRQLSNVQTWTVQCSLPVNIFSEKVFILDWFILVAMGIVNTVYFVYSLIETISSRWSEALVNEHIVLEDGKRFTELQSVPDQHDDFVHSYLRKDGVFLIWLISTKVNPVVATEIVTALWRKYIEKTDVV